MLGVLSVISCSTKQEIPSTDVIPQNQMVEILKEIELAQAAIKIGVANKDSTIYENSFFQSIFLKYNTTQEQFNSSLKFYGTHPEILEELYDKVITELSEEQATYQVTTK